MFKRILEWLCVINAKQCSHPDNEIVADILEGELCSSVGIGVDTCVQYCRCCGSYRFVITDYIWDTKYAGWRMPGKAWS